MKSKTTKENKRWKVVRQP